MRKFFKQAEQIFRMACGFILFPGICLLLLCKAGIEDYNFSGLLALRQYQPLIYPAALLLLVWILRCFYLIQDQLTVSPVTGKILIIFFSISYLCALFIHYEEGNAVLSSLHLFAAYCAFGLFTAVLMLSLSYTRERNLYIAILFLFFLLCLRDGEISGMAELVYAAGSCWLLTWNTLKKKH